MTYKFNARRLRLELHRHGWSTRELSRRLECSPSSVSRWTRGLSTPSGSTVVQFANLFKVDPICFY